MNHTQNPPSTSVKQIKTKKKNTSGLVIHGAEAEMKRVNVRNPSNDTNKYYAKYFNAIHVFPPIRHVRRHFRNGHTCNDTYRRYLKCRLSERL